MNLHNVMVSCSVPLVQFQHSATRSCAIVAPLLPTDNPSAIIDAERRLSLSLRDLLERAHLAARQVPTALIARRLRISHLRSLEVHAEEAGLRNCRLGDMTQVPSANSAESLVRSIWCTSHGVIAGLRVVKNVHARGPGERRQGRGEGVEESRDASGRGAS